MVNGTSSQLQEDNVFTSVYHSFCSRRGGGMRGEVGGACMVKGGVHGK